MKSKVSFYVLILVILAPIMQLIDIISINYYTFITILLMIMYLASIKSLKFNINIVFLLYYIVNLMIIRVFIDVNIDPHSLRYLLLFPLSALFSYEIIYSTNFKIINKLVNFMIIWALINSILAFIQVITHSYSYYWPSQIETLNQSSYNWNVRNYFRYISSFNILFPGLGFYKTVMSLGHYLLMIFPVTIYNYIKTKNIYNLITIFLITIGIIFTFSRGSLIAMSLIILIILYNEKMITKNINKLIMTILISVLFLFLFYSFYSIIQNYFFSNEVNLYGRVFRWVEIVKYSFEKPVRLIFGFGPFYFRDIVFTELNLTSNIHNVFLQIFLELGIVGFLIFLKIIYNMIKIIKLKRTEKVYFINYGILAFFISQFFDHTFFGFHGTIIFILLGITEKLNNRRILDETANNNSNI